MSFNYPIISAPLHHNQLSTLFLPVVTHGRIIGGRGGNPMNVTCMWRCNNRAHAPSYDEYSQRLVIIYSPSIHLSQTVHYYLSIILRPQWLSISIVRLALSLIVAAMIANTTTSEVIYAVSSIDELIYRPNRLLK
jgi:hypothetical protein